MSSVWSSGIHLRTISWDIPQPPFAKVSVKITYLELIWNLPGTNELSFEHSEDSSKWLTYLQMPSNHPLEPVLTWFSYLYVSCRVNPENYMNYGNSFVKCFWTIWHKTRFGSQILATNFGVFFIIYICNVFKNMFDVALIMMWQSIVVVGFPTTETWALENLEGYQLW